MLERLMNAKNQYSACISFAIYVIENGIPKTSYSIKVLEADFPQVTALVEKSAFK